ncbi:phage tail assembly chaperone [bacterium]|nr:phage tail assembly chaperone [bacterium]
MTKINANGVVRDMTPEEQAEYDERFVAFDEVAEKLKTIRNMRLQKLQETDYLALSDVTMSDAVKTWRQTLRDLPQNNTTEAKYDELLAKDSSGNLTHSVWTKPS